METVTLSTWEEFLQKVTDLREQFELPEDSISTGGLLFRGQSNSEWKLETTLERAAGAGVSLMNYFRKVSCCLPLVESFTDRQWNLPTYEDYLNSCTVYDNLIMKSVDKGLEFFVYLRHQGFPSPLLDWSRSLYVASFFAFKDARIENSHVSIFCYLETSGYGKCGGSDQPFIQTIGPYIRTHKRHHLQQSYYTRCIDYNDGDAQYVSHYAVFNNGADGQDHLWEFRIPVSEKFKVLTRLDMSNINAFSLFGSEESLMSTVAFREFSVRGIDP
jgi:hypothetical protein